ncbi:MAG: protein kinase [Nannocystaceae bacterium]
MSDLHGTSEGDAPPELATEGHEFMDVKAELDPTRADAHHGVLAEKTPDHITFVGVDLDDKYKIIRPIGKGGMGTIFLGEHTGIGKRVAIKLLSSKYSGNEQVIQRFLQEARSAARIRHKNVVEIYDCGRTSEGLPFFAMELLHGIDIRRMMKQTGPLPWPRALRLMRQICAALEAAHQAGIVHRDMKPGNCFVVDDGEEPDVVKVLDFGIAKVLSDDDSEQELTHTGMVMGTAHYMSPEQARSEALDKRADVYSAGVILYQLLTGKLPYEGKGFMGTLSKHLTEPIPSLIAAAEGRAVPRALEAVIQKVLAKDRDERYQSAAEFAAALDEIGEHPRTSLTMSMTVRAESLRERIGLPWLPIAAIGAGVVALAVGLVMYLGDEPEPVAPPAAPPVVAEVAVPEPPTPDAPPVAAAEATTAADAVVDDTDAVVDATEESAAETDVAAGETDAGAESEPEDEPPTKTPERKTKKREKVHKPREAASLPERPSSAAIAEGFAGVSGDVSACKAKGWFPGQSIKVKLSISPDGAVTKATALGAIAGTALARCVEKAVKGARFAKSEKGTSYTKTFTN